MNLGDHCWLYDYPRGQWRHGERCRAMDDPAVRREFATAQKQPTVKTRKELRRRFFRSRHRFHVHREPGNVR